MWFFESSISITESGVLQGMTDCHSHLLPSVDDGVKTEKDTFVILDEMERQGVRKVWLTPHIMEDIPNETVMLQQKFQNLRQEYRGKVELSLAAEYMLDALFEKRLQQDDLLPLEEDKRYLLVETSYFNPPMDLLSTLKRIQSKGYYPLLAHPERYEYMQMKDYKHLKEDRISFQLNVPSLTGMYGKHVQKKAEILLKAGMYDYIGNDTHSVDFYLAIIAAKHGVQITGVDINPHVVEMTNAGHLHIIEPGMEKMLQEVVKTGMLKASVTPEVSDAYFMVVPTPFKGNHEPDVSYVEAATRAVLPLLKEGDLYVIESTSPIGTTEAMARIIFNGRPELEGKIYIAYCPERVLPGNVIYELVHNDRVIGGLNIESTDKAIEFYSQFVQGTLHKTNCRTAEMCKLTENSSRDVQIAFANELSLICDKAGINVWELVNLANKHPRVNILQPGCGVGGHCIAVDPYFITADFPAESKLISDARDINNYKSFWCAEKVKNAMLEFELKHHRKPCVAMMGLAFKPNIDDLRESPAKYITTKVMQSCNNADILVVEPNVKEHNVFKLTDYREAYDKANIVVFLTAHKEFKELSWREDKMMLDFCGVFKK